MKKPCKFATCGHLELYQNERSSARVCQAESDRFCDDFLQLFVTNHSRECVSFSNMLGSGLDGRSCEGPDKRVGRLRDRPGRKSEPRRRVLAEPRADLVHAALQLERPDRVGRVHMQRAVPCEPRRPPVTPE